jgi:hypothetical protein
MLWVAILLWLSASAQSLQAAQSRKQDKPSLNQSDLNHFQDSTKQATKEAELPTRVLDQSYNSILQRLSRLEAENKASSTDALLRGWLAIVLSTITGIIAILGLGRTISLDRRMKSEPHFRFMWKSYIPLLASHIDETLAWCQQTPLDLNKEIDFPWRTIHGIEYNQEIPTPDKTALNYHKELARAIARYTESTSSLCESLSEFNKLIYPTSEEWCVWTQIQGMYQLTIDGNSSEEEKEHAARNQKAFIARNKEVQSLAAKYTNSLNPTVRDLKSTTMYRDDLSRLHSILLGNHAKACADAKSLKSLLEILFPLYKSTDD